MRMAGDEHVYAFTRRLGGVELFVLGNFSGLDAPAPDAVEWAADELLLGNYEDAPVDHSTLRPWEARVYRRIA